MDTDQTGPDKQTAEPVVKEADAMADTLYDAFSVGQAMDIIQRFCKNGTFEPTTSVVEVLQALEAEKQRLLAKHP